MAKDRLSMVVFSGTVDKLYPVAIMASGAVAMGQEVEIFLTFWGLNAFRKGAPASNDRISKDFEEMGPAVKQLLAEKKVPSWMDMLRQAKELGNVHVHACGMTMDLFDLKLENLEDIVDDVMGVAGFIEGAQEGKITLFI